ncbi:hypothetical protein SERLADRAFT_455820 [Serpula lacrymans var. lacrymans S7.9]|uniref:Uncharacterized protein n=1 Tax=Serpula lacrymans var. lacrymans (strain S7.9) TaxID=578457 RepID=F8NEY0_SERL9|nr:uncharacterized protein SERLADRAFT_455820 [Serpula lacrymans var. lacrymans S7.9]EGO31128.1 hypothetical protein SERLADRAFT_455820 [Serpula lacrymans var. lacrymans S7.9]
MAEPTQTPDILLQIHFIARQLFKLPNATRYPDYAKHGRATRFSSWDGSRPRHQKIATYDTYDRKIEGHCKLVSPHQ